MRAPLRCIILVILVPLAGLSNVAHAQSVIDEIRVGVYEHDSGLIGRHKEPGADIVLEALSRPLSVLSFIGTPRLLLGGNLNSAGRTDQIYIGLIRSWDLFRGVANPNDAIFLEGTLGGGWNDGKIDVQGTPAARHWKSHGSHFLFRESIDIGYRFTPKWAVALNFNHISNAGLAHRNEGMNDIGVTVNMKLGPR